MEFEGKVILELPMQSGTSKAGNPWKKREYVLETFGTYPRKVKVYAFGDRADRMPLEVGKDYRLGIDIESREFNGRWYTDVSMFSAQEIAGPGVAPQQAPYGAAPQPAYGDAPAAAPQQAPAFGAPAAPAFDSAPANDEDLPF